MVRLLTKYEKIIILYMEFCPARLNPGRRGVGNMFYKYGKRFSKLSAYACILWAGLCLASACAGAAPVKPSLPTPAPDSIPSPGNPGVPTVTTTTSTACSFTKWSLDFTRSGGFAGRTSSLQLSSAGELTILGTGGKPAGKASLTAGELAQIRQVLPAVCAFPAGHQPRMCPDCFTYRLDVRLDGRAYSAEATDVDLAGLGPLIQALSPLFTKAPTAQP
jgi:hypothetical protein